MCKKLFCLVIFVSLLGLVSNASADLVAHWPLDVDFNDYSGSGFHGTPSGASLITDDERGQVLSLDGASYVDCGNPNDLNFGTGNWSVCAWVKTTMLGTGGDPDKGVIYAKGGDRSGGHRYGLYVNENQDPPGRISLITDDNVSGDDAKKTVNSSVIVSDGEWHHVVGLRDVSSLHVYIDGVLDGTNATLIAGYDLSGTNQHNAYIGAITNHEADPAGSILEKFLIGSVDDVRVYDYALSQSDIIMVATPLEAWNPNPADGSDVRPEDLLLLTWRPGSYADKHTVYFGPSLDDVNESATSVSIKQDANSYDLSLYTAVYGPLDFDTTYYWRIDEVNEVGPTTGLWTGRIWTFYLMRPNRGVIGVYYHWVDPSVGGGGNPGPSDPYQTFVLERIDPEIDFEWGSGSPDPCVNANQFSVQWVGEVEAEFSETYTFTTRTDDGARLWIGGQQVIDAWIEQGVTRWSGTIDLVAGESYPLLMEYYENGGGAVAQLFWSSPNTPEEIVPQRFLSLPLRAFDPNPRHRQELSADEVTVLSWKSGIKAAQHTVYFGTSLSDVNESATPVSIEQAANTYDPITGGDITEWAWETTYYWRIDEVNDANTWKGDIWSFTTGKVYYVDADAVGANDGSSWADAYNFLQDALADANSTAKPVEIWVAQGIYTADTNSADPNGSGDRMATFQLINGVAIYGGYAGFGQPKPNARNVIAYETILSGDLNGNDADVNDPLDLLDDPCRADNSYHVVTGSGTNETAVLDGFTITAGNANGTVPDFWDPEDNAGGMLNESGSPKLTNCTFSGNAAYGCGGGMYNLSNSSPIIKNCTFTGNLAGWHGGGMENDASSPILTNCTFSGNLARDSNGGGMRTSGGNLTLTNCRFSGNSTGREGGGMLTHGSSLTLTNCTFSGNSAGDYGGGMYTYGSSATLTDCVFTGNSAGIWAGGLYNWRDSSSIITNCIFTGNSAPQRGALFIWDDSSMIVRNCTFTSNSADSAIYTSNSSPTIMNCILWDAGGIGTFNSTVTVTYSCVKGGYPGVGNIDTDPCFLDPANEDYHLSPDSPCIDAGTDAGIYTDIEGNIRPFDYPGVDNNGELPDFDMGAYEARPIGVVVIESEGSTQVMESGPTSDDFTVELVKQPTDYVTIVIDPNINGEDISLDSEAPGEPITLVFTMDDWNTPQSVTVWAVNDYYCEGEEIAELVFDVSSSDPNFDEEWILPLYVTIVDNDTGDVVIVESGGSTEVSEEGPTSDQYTMVLASQPTADVNIHLEDISEPDQVLVEPELVVFTPNDWNTPQMVTVTAVDDDVWEPGGAHYTAISHTIDTDDAVYQQVDVGNVSVLVHDNDKADVRIEPVVVLIDPAATSEVRTTLPDSMSAVVQGGIYYVEIWASDTGATNTGLTSVYVDVSFCEQASATELYHGTIFTAFQEGTIQPDGVDDFGGSALPSGGGIEPEWVRVGWIKMTGATVETCTISLLPTDNEFLEVAALGREVPWDQIDLGSVDLQITPAAKSYDLNGDGSIGSVDLALFADSWLDTVPPANEAHDFDCDGFVGVGDLSWFATGWMKYTDDPTILYPPCSGSDGGTMLAGNNTPFQLGLAHTSIISATTKTSEAPADVALELVVLDAPSASDTTTALPTSIHNITNGQTYYLEIWVSDVGYVNTGVSCAYVDLSFPADAASLTNISYGGIFTMFTDGTVDSGVIDELGGSTLSEEVGAEPEWARLVVVEMHADAAPPLVTFALSPSSTGVSAWGRGIIPWDDILLPSVTIGLADFDHDGDVDMVDFAFFALNWMDTGCGVCGGADLTGDGNVKLDDLREFADNWLAGVE